MRRTAISTGFGLLIATLALGCSDAATSSSSGTPPLTSVPDFAAVVTQVSHNVGIAPGGHLDQYELFVAVPPATQANAGLILGRSSSVYRQTAAGTYVTQPSAVVVGQTLDVWLASGPAYGSVEAPPGSPAYFVKQVVIRR